MSYHILPLMHYTHGDVEAGQAILMASMPFAGAIKKIHARLSAGTAETFIKVGVTVITGSQVSVTTAKTMREPSPHIPVAEDDTIYLIIADPVNAENLYVQLTIERV